MKILEDMRGDTMNRIYYMKIIFSEINKREKHTASLLLILQERIFNLQIDSLL